MHSRLYPAALLALLAALAFASTATAATPKLGKPAARKAAVKRMNSYLAKRAWAKTGRIGRCWRAKRGHVVCAMRVRGGRRVCKARIKVRRRGRAKVGKPRCRKLPASKRVPSASTRALLSAWIGQPMREPVAPLDVTYPHGAGTTLLQTLTGEEEPAPTSPGVLALYVDGRLECAANVNEANPQAECPVAYDRLGTYRVTTIYTSGSESAADTLIHTVDPLPTSVSVDVSYEPLPEARFLAAGWECSPAPCELPEGHWESADLEIGTLTVSVDPVQPWGSMPSTDCPFGSAPGCVAISPTDGRQTFPVVALADLIVAEAQVLEEGEPINAQMQTPKLISLPGSGIGQVTPAEIGAGDYYANARSGFRSGYLESQGTAPIRFSPAATAAIRFR